MPHVASSSAALSRTLTVTACAVARPSHRSVAAGLEGGGREKASGRTAQCMMPAHGSIRRRPTRAPSARYRPRQRRRPESRSAERSGSVWGWCVRTEGFRFGGVGETHPGVVDGEYHQTRPLVARGEFAIGARPVILEGEVLAARHRSRESSMPRSLRMKGTPRNAPGASPDAICARALIVVRARYN